MRSESMTDEKHEQAPAPDGDDRPAGGELFALLVRSVRDYAIFALDPSGRIVSWNEGAARMKGYRAEEIIGQHFSVFYPEVLREQGYPDRELEVAAREGVFHDEGWRIRNDGSRFWAHVVITALRDDEGHLVGFGKVTRDLTSRMREEELRESDDRMRLLAENLDDVFYVGDPRLGRLVYVSPAFEQVYGHSPAPLTREQRELLDIVHPDDRDRVGGILDEQAEGRATDVVYRVVRGNGEVRWIHDRSFPVERDEGRFRRTVGIAEDVTDWKRVEDGRELLAEATRFLSASLEPEEVLRGLGRITVPRLADWCRVHVLEEDGSVRAGVASHADPGKVELARELERRFPPQPGGADGVHEVLATGETRLFAAVGEEDLRRSTANGDHLRMLQELGLQSSVVAPLKAGGRVLGAISLASSSGRRYGDEDVHLVRELASRAALALENARLFEAERRARERAERRAAANGLLLRASTLLASSLDYRETLRRLADLMVPELADVASVYVMEPGGRLEWVAAAGADARVTGILEGARTSYDPVRHPNSVVLEALATGRTQRVANVTPGQVASWVRDGNREILADLGVCSVLTAPMAARGQRVGVLALAQARSGRRFSGEDEALAEELARRAAVAVDNARLFRRAEAARKAAEEASRAKSDFLAVMSHELRTPLNAIVGYGDLLDSGVSGAMNEKQQQHLERIRASAWHLLDLIDEILSLSRIETGHMEFHVEEVDAGELAREAAELVRPDAETRGLDFHLEAPDRAVVVETDAGRLRQILLNLLSNAVKFTDQGAVVLSWERVGAEVRFHVRDTGPGVPEEEQERIFEPFTRSRAAAQARRDGTGLGLSVSRRLARLMGGDVTLESAPGAGSVFTVKLPVEAMTEA